MASPSTSDHSPAIPKFILRGHVAPIHALHFFNANAFLASADSEGWLVIWSLASKRAVAVWKAHEGGILEVNDWGRQRLITHGRDHRLRVWQVREDDVSGMNVKLPVDGADAETSRQPWLLHSLSVNALNFCAFALCYDQVESSNEGQGYDSGGGVDLDEVNQALVQSQLEDKKGDEALLIAAPNGLDQGGIDFFHLPSEHRLSKLPSDQVTKTGMVMALSLFYHPVSSNLVVVSGYEDGHIMVHVRQALQQSDEVWVWLKVLVSRPHTQPVLSLDVSTSKECFITSSADAVLAKFDVPSVSNGVDLGAKPRKTVNTKHAGQQDLRMRTDGKIFATAGWDARVRVYSVKTMKELAVLKWHKAGCYAVSFAEIEPELEAGTPGISSRTGSDLAKDGSHTNGGGMLHSALDKIKYERGVKAQATHWLAAGGKDAKISLWDIY